MMKTTILLSAALVLLALQAGDPALARAAETQTMPIAEPAPRPATVATATSDAPALGTEVEEPCCNGVGGPDEEEEAVVVGQAADPAGGQRYRLAPTDANLERRYGPRPAPSLNPITLRF